MLVKMKIAYIVFCSPSGSTAHVARVMADSLKKKSITTHFLDIGAGENPSRFIDLLKTAVASDCLFVGSPVYRELAVPPVMNFIESLPTADGCRAVPFVTWGGATSGVALWQMGQALHGKGYVLAGGAKVLALHSMMWSNDQPVGQGHPDADDDRQVRNLVERLAETTTPSISLATLDYQAETAGAEFKKKLDRPWMIIPKTIDEAACTQCGTCEAVCPVSAVVLAPSPVFQAHCFDCFNCVRECPEDAIIASVPLEKIEATIRQRVETFNERPLTQVFY